MCGTSNVGSDISVRRYCCQLMGTMVPEIYKCTNYKLELTIEQQKPSRVDGLRALKRLSTAVSFL